MKGDNINDGGILGAEQLVEYTAANRRARNALNEDKNNRIESKS